MYIKNISNICFKFIINYAELDLVSCSSSLEVYVSDLSISFFFCMCSGLLHLIRIPVSALAFYLSSLCMYVCCSDFLLAVFTHGFKILYLEVSLNINASQLMYLAVQPVYSYCSGPSYKTAKRTWKLYCECWQREGNVRSIQNKSTEQVYQMGI
jgi:hypothetical protein